MPRLVLPGDLVLVLQNQDRIIIASKSLSKVDREPRGLLSRIIAVEAYEGIYGQNSTNLFGSVIALDDELGDPVVDIVVVVLELVGR